MMRFVYILLVSLLLLPCQISAGENQSAARVYQQSMVLAAQGNISESIIALQAASSVLSKEDIWQQRMIAASVLLAARKAQVSQWNTIEDNHYLQLATAYAQAHPQPEAVRVWPAALLASIFPGAGHAWLGRWHDAGVAALFVWPLLLLTWWAARRKMGPVTVFFALLTAWLWSGTIFSAISLAERGSLEMYVQWWQGVWQAAALPHRPW